MHSKRVSRWITSGHLHKQQNRLAQKWGHVGSSVVQNCLAGLKSVEGLKPISKVIWAKGAYREILLCA
eukprot:2618957-Rhodomonas_salina.1